MVFLFFAKEMINIFELVCEFLNCILFLVGLFNCIDSCLWFMVKKGYIFGYFDLICAVELNKHKHIK